MTIIDPVAAGQRDQEDPVGATPAIGRARLLEVVASVAAQPDLWRPRVHHQLYRRFYERVVSAEDHEVWLICWDVGQMTLLHDHGTSAGAFVVVDGALLEDHGRAGTGRLRQRRISRGRIMSFGPKYVHNLTNPGPGPRHQHPRLLSEDHDDDVLRRAARRGGPRAHAAGGVARACGCVSRP